MGSTAGNRIVPAECIDLANVDLSQSAAKFPEHQDCFRHARINLPRIADVEAKLRFTEFFK